MRNTVGREKGFESNAGAFYKITVNDHVYDYFEVSRQMTVSTAVCLNHGNEETISESRKIPVFIATF